ncbi:MAG: ZIP family metal transporter [bacterium]|jgi:ZIP family zinc transporter
MDGGQLLRIALFGLLAGVVGTGAGGFLAYLLPRPRAGFLGGILGFAAGMMMAVIFFGLLDQALQEGGQFTTSLGVIAGIGGFLLIDALLPHQHLSISDREKESAAYLAKGLLLTVGISLHNLPEGLAIGAGYAASLRTGLALTLVLGLHNIPEGLILAIPWKTMGRGRQGLWVSLLAGVPMGLGALLGGKVGNISPLFLALALSFAAGGMLYIVCDELIPDAYKHNRNHFAILGLGIGVVLGLLLTAGR